ncbi:MAG: hypothetical protein HY427_00980 [Candidatus Levybacteria bacterium]|nr:hypothetical protein [Candidatus Levybacteria bacterium]
MRFSESFVYCSRYIWEGRLIQDESESVGRFIKKRKYILDLIYDLCVAILDLLQNAFSKEKKITPHHRPVKKTTDNRQLAFIFDI